MTTTVQTEGIRGTVEPGFEPVADRLGESVIADPSYAGTLCVHHHGRRVLDLWWGSGTKPDELLPVFSSSKGAAGIVVACLVRDGLVDLNAPVASLWPEFAERGKAAVPVRQLLSHQAGLLGVDGGFDYDELYGHAPAGGATRRATTTLGAGHRTRIPRADHRSAGRRARPPGDGRAPGRLPAGTRDGPAGTGRAPRDA